MNKWEDREVAFFGKITAGITHELKNVLAIIRESAGLMEDIMSISPEALITHQDKVQNSLNKIKDQVERGVNLTDRLNKFAHSSDETVAKVDLHNTIEQFVALSQRFARLKNIVMKTDFPKQPGRGAVLVTRPIQFQMALFAAIECCFHAMPAGGTIHIGFEQNQETAVVRVLCEGDLPAKTKFADNLSAFEKWPVLQKIAASLNGSAGVAEVTYGLVLSLPNEMRA